MKKFFRLKEGNLFGKYFFRYFLVIFSVFTIIFLFEIYSQYQIFKKELIIEETHHVENHTEIIKYKLKGVYSDLISQSRHPDLLNYINTNNPEYLQHFQNEMKNFIKITGNYDQIRYIDINGNEIVRINYCNGSPQIVSGQELQNKKNRYYFTDSIRLNRDEIYISKFDLNIEHGQIEIPRKPMLRMATTVFNNMGVKKGIFILNYLGDDVINTLNKRDEKVMARPLLLNKEGYFLLGEKKEYEWGFMYENKKDFLFKTFYPDAWRIIDEKPSGHFSIPDGLFAFDTIKVGNDFKIILNPSDNKPERINNELDWKIIFFCPQNKLIAVKLGIIKNELPIFLVINLVAVITSQMLSKYKEKKDHAQEETRKLAIAVIQSPASVVITKPDGKIEYVNPAFSNVTGFSPSEAIGRNSNIVKSGLQNNEFYKSMWTTISGGKEWRGELCNRKKNGDLFWESVYVSPVIDKDKKIINYIAVKQDISERKETEKALRKLSITDGLTGVFNRRKFDEAIESELHRAMRNHLPISLMMIDIDFFKKFNDYYGHQEGDKCLKAVADVLEKSLRRAGDLPTRYGGEEFAVILPETKGEQAVKLAEMVRKEIENLKIPHKDSTVSDFVTISIGVAHSVENTGISTEKIIHFADTALYEAKRQGRNQVVDKKIITG